MASVIYYLEFQLELSSESEFPESWLMAIFYKNLVKLVTADEEGAFSFNSVI